MNVSPSAGLPLHPLLLLSDSALPLGSFAFSSGLESFLAHHKAHPSPHSNPTQRLQAFDRFLQDSLSNVASTALPYVTAGYHHPESLALLDNDFDASTPCTVARRASVSQGRALLVVWEKALASSVPTASSTSEPADLAMKAAASLISSFALDIKTSKPDDHGLTLNAHFAPLFGAVCCALGLSNHETMYLFLLNHAKAVLSAAVRASVLGPYQSQGVLASVRLQGWIGGCIKREIGRGAEEAAVTAPVMDLWMGRHELLYSRIFNS